MYCIIYLMIIHVYLLFYIVDDLVCRVWLTHRRSDHRFLWNINLLLIVLDGTRHTINRTIANGFNRFVLTMENGIVPTPCISILCVYWIGPCWDNYFCLFNVYFDDVWWRQGCIMNRLNIDVLTWCYLTQNVYMHYTLNSIIYLMNE